ncbi:retrotransposon protein, putative, ty1-copia subclass [Tanacetum coccineum]
MHLAWPLWSDLRVIPTHGEFSSLSETIRYSGVSLRNKNILDLTSLIGTDNFGWSYQPIPAAPVAVVPDQPISPQSLATYKEQEEGQSVSSYVLKMKSHIDQLERLGHPVTLQLRVNLILVGLFKEYDSFVQNYNINSMGKTINELHAMLKLHEETLPKKVVAPALHGLRGSKKLNPGALSLYVGNGQCEVVVSIGNYHLCLPSGLVSVLNNCHYAPSITRGIISVSRLYEDGFINSFELNNTIYVSKNNVVYFTAIPRDGLYEIEMSFSNTNDSSMYAVSNKRAKLKLDSSLLWHCRLGHISKKRIKKLQHDGLLNSSKIESLGKCVSCKLGKMARKPYSHQVERAKDLLGLIHTDVCGLFRIVSRQGSNYFVTFTDDFSWSIGLFPIALLPTRLNIMECQIGEIEHSKKVDKTPYEIWHGQAPKLSYLKVRGCEALVKCDTLTKPDKLEPRSFECIFIGYPKETMGYSFYNPSERKVFVARNAEFFESNLIDQQASGCLKDLEIIQEEDTNRSLDTSLNYEADDQEIDEPQSDINPIRSYALWEVIVNGDAPAIASASVGTEGPIPPKTVEQKLARKNELKAKSTLLLAIPDEHLSKFHGTTPHVLGSFTTSIYSLFTFSIVRICF